MAAKKSNSDSKSRKARLGLPDSFLNESTGSNPDTLRESYFKSSESDSTSSAMKVKLQPSPIATNTGQELIAEGLGDT